MLDLLAVQSGTANATLITLAYTLILTFILSSVIAWTYEKTFLGLSYSRNFVQAIVLSAVVAAIVMQAIGDNVGRGLGMMGALSVVRFRTSFKDPRDIMFVFASVSDAACTPGVLPSVEPLRSAQSHSCFPVQVLEPSTSLTVCSVLPFRTKVKPEPKLNRSCMIASRPTS